MIDQPQPEKPPVGQTIAEPPKADDKPETDSRTSPDKTDSGTPAPKPDTKPVMAEPKTDTNRAVSVGPATPSIEEEAKPATITDSNKLPVPSSGEEPAKPPPSVISPLPDVIPIPVPLTPIKAQDTNQPEAKPPSPASAATPIMAPSTAAKAPETRRVEDPEESAETSASPVLKDSPPSVTPGDKGDKTVSIPNPEVTKSVISDKDETLVPGSPSPVATGIICPTCGHRNRVGVLICDNCGTTLVAGVKSSVGTRDLTGAKDDKAVSGEKLLDTNQAKAVETAGTWNFTDDMVLKIEIEGGSTPMLVYPKQEIIIGRRDPNTGTLPDVDLTAYAGYRMGVSRRHASIRLQDRQLNLSDLGSSNGTFLNGTRLIGHRPYQLRDGDEIRIGQMVLKIFFQSNRKKSE